MAKRFLNIHGAVVAKPAAATILVNGTQVFSGQIGSTLNLDEFTNNLLTVSYDTDATAIIKNTISVSIAITSGVVKLGHMESDNFPADDGKDQWILPTSNKERTKILINGQDPEYPPYPLPPEQSPGPQDNPHWMGWNFELSAGETLTCDVEVPAKHYTTSPIVK